MRRHELTKREELHGACELAEYLLELPVPRHACECPVEGWLAFLGHRWNALILWHLQGGRRRHGELAAALAGVSPKVLSERLQGLEARGLLERWAAPVFPREVAYGLTPAGQDLLRVLNALEVWSSRFGQRG